MKKFSIEQLAQIIEAEPAKDIEGHFAGVSSDSRTIREGECFFAVRGENFDGHDYVSDAFAKGASCAVVSRAAASAGGAILKVDDTVKALGDFARWYRRAMKFKVVGITGSVGKTTTRQIISHVLSRHFGVYQSPKNFNNFIGLPLTLLGSGPEAQIVIAEMASNHPGELSSLSRIALPDIAVITNVYPSHLAGFGDLQVIIEEKLSISDGLAADGIFIINADFGRLVDACRAKGRKFVTFGSCDAGDISYDRLGSSFTIDGGRIDLPLAGRGNVENALAAWAVCSRLGVGVSDFSQALKSMPAVPMRAEVMQIGTLTVLDDCYNANPASMKNALDILSRLGSYEGRRLVFVCGEMAELGGQSRRLHVELGSLIVQAKVGLLVTVGRGGRVAGETAEKLAEYDLQTKSFEDAASVCDNLKEFVKDYDIILVKGSREVGLERVVEELKELFCVDLFYSSRKPEDAK